MLCDVLHTVAKLQRSLQSKSIDLFSITAMVECTLKWLQKEDYKSCTWFKDHLMVFTDVLQLGSRNITEEKEEFLCRIYRPYLQSVINNINARMESTDFISSMSIFDPRHLPSSGRELSDYGMENLRVLTSVYGTSQKVIFDVKEAVSQPDVDVEVTESEWKLFIYKNHF